MTVSGAVQQVTKWSENVLTLTATLDANGDVFGGEVDLTNYQSVSIQVLSGTGTVQFEVLNDLAGAWQPKELQRSSGGSANNSQGALGLWSGDLGANRFRARMSALSVPVTIEISAYPQSFVGAGISVNGMTPGSGASNLGKNEDAVHASGDTGVEILGVRVPATPAVQTSAAGDYGALAVTSDGKQVVAGQGAEEHTWQGGVTVTNSAADAVLIAAAAAGVRRYLTDLIISNKHSAAVDILIKDGATQIGVPIQVAAGATLVLDFSTPIRGTAATALNVNVGAAVAGAVHFFATGYIGV